MLLMFEHGWINTSYRRIDVINHPYLNIRLIMLWKGLVSNKSDNGKVNSLAPGPWWRHQMETFSALLAICAGNSPVPVNSPHKGLWRGALMFSLNKRLSKQSWGWWFETLSRPLWRHRNDKMLNGLQTTFLNAFSLHFIFNVFIP